MFIHQSAICLFILLRIDIKKKHLITNFLKIVTSEPLQLIKPDLYVRLYELKILMIMLP
jgi:hypothetical protein